MFKSFFIMLFLSTFSFTTFLCFFSSFSISFMTLVIIFNLLTCFCNCVCFTLFFFLFLFVFLQLLLFFWCKLFFFNVTFCYSILQFISSYFARVFTNVFPI